MAEIKLSFEDFKELAREGERRIFYFVGQYSLKLFFIEQHIFYTEILFKDLNTAYIEDVVKNTLIQFNGNKVRVENDITR